jgi:hypothetical protein
MDSMLRRIYQDLRTQPRGILQGEAGDGPFGVVSAGLISQHVGGIGAWLSSTGTTPTADRDCFAPAAAVPTIEELHPNFEICRSIRFEPLQLFGIDPTPRKQRLHGGCRGGRAHTPSPPDTSFPLRLAKRGLRMKTFRGTLDDALLPM